MANITNEVGLVEDTLAGNNIPPNADFLQWAVSRVHTDGFTLGFIADEEENFDTSKNHWAMVLETSRGQVRMSMESRKNGKTVHRQTYSWQGPAVTVKQVLEFVLARAWHKFKMATTTGGAKNGCRHHLKTMLLGFQAYGWIGTKSDEGRNIDDYLPFAYTKDEDDYETIHVKPKSIDLGEFL